MTDYSEWVVLLVEDDMDSAIMLNEVLDLYGIELQVARNGNECLVLLADLAPTIIVMDLAMPDMDGWETLAALRDNPHTASIPVVAITAYHSTSVARDAKTAGFDAYFPKPLELDFVETLAALVE